jgi:hypothetical protein
LLKQLHVHGLIKKIGRSYKYYLTRLRRRLRRTTSRRDGSARSC